MHTIWDVVLLVVLIGAAAANAWLWGSRARRAQRARPKLWGALGGVGFIVLVFLLLGLFANSDTAPGQLAMAISGGSAEVAFCLVVVLALLLSLAIVKVLGQHNVAAPQEPRPRATAQTRTMTSSSAALAPPENLPFSWGAAGLPVIWLLFHGRIVQALALLVFSVICLPFLEEPLLVLAYLAVPYTIAIWLGRSGGTIAWQHHRANSLEQLVEKERTWNIVGMIVFVVLALANALLFIRSL